MTTTKRIVPRGEVTSLAELRAAGWTRSAIRHAVNDGRLHPLYRGTFAIGRPEVSEEGRLRAAVHASGPGAALAHLSAAWLWRLVERLPPRPHVIIPGTRGGKGIEGVILHRSATLSPQDVTVRGAIPVTTVERTLIDVAGTLPRAPLKAAVRAAERLHGIDLQRLIERVTASLPSPHHARLRRALLEYVPGVALTESELEARFFELCAKHRLPTPEPQVWIGPHRVDFLFRDRRVVVELDGRRWHDGRAAFGDDRARIRALQAMGFIVLQFTWADVVNRPAKTAREVRATLR